MVGMLHLVGYLAADESTASLSKITDALASAKARFATCERMRRAVEQLVTDVMIFLMQYRCSM